MSTLSPRRANAAARFTADVVLPTPPFWLTTARMRPTLRLRREGVRAAAGAQALERVLCVLHPAVRLRAARWRCEERLEVLRPAGDVAALQQEKREPVVRARQSRLDVERPAVAADRFVHLPGAREGD